MTILMNGVLRLPAVRHSLSAVAALTIAAGALILVGR